MTASKAQPKSGKRGPASDIPDKLYFRIGEVSQLVGVEAHVLRYWEKEISTIRPGKSVSNQRRYRRRDVELFREIRRLLYEEKYTLAGARRRLLTKPQGGSAMVPLGDIIENDMHELSQEDLAGDPELLGLHWAQPSAAPLPPPPSAPPISANLLDHVRAGLRDLIELAEDAFHT